MTLDIHNEALWTAKSYKPTPLAADTNPINRGISYAPSIDAMWWMKRNRQTIAAADPEEIHLSYQPRLEPPTKLTDGMIHLAMASGYKKYAGHRIHRTNGGGGRGDWRLPPQHIETGWSEGIEELPAEMGYEKDTTYEHGPLPTPNQALLLQWKNAKASRKWASKQISWGQLMTALNENQNTGHALHLDTSGAEEESGSSWIPTGGDPLDALMEAEQDEIREDSRQYLLGMLMRSMTKRQRKALDLKALGLTDLQISKKMRTSRPTIQREIAKIHSLAATLTRK